MPEDLPLEPDLIKVLAADTRREILGLLQDRRMTVTELSRELDLGKATVHEHLNKLTDAGLVQRDEDDRLWVYYELTGRGKRMLNPQRTRFYLALASAIVAALVAGLAVYGFMQAGVIADETQAGPSVTVTDGQAYAGEPVQLGARVNATELDAYLVDEQAAEQIREGNLDVQGLPLRASPIFTAAGGTGEGTRVQGERTLLRSDASLPPGTYYLYVRTPEGDNAPSMPSIRLIGLEASLDRSTWYQDLDRGPLVVNVTQEASPIDGTLRLGGGARDEAVPTVPIEEGTARLSARALDLQSPGTYRLSVQPDGTARWIDLEESLTVTRAPLAVHPLHVREGQTSSVSVDVGGPDRLRSIEPTVQGADADVHDASTGWRIDLASPDPGEVGIQLARRASIPVAIHPTSRVQATLEDGPQVTWRITSMDQEPSRDAALYLDGNSLGFTNETGRLTTQLPEEGDHVLRILRPDGRILERHLVVDGWRIEQPPSQVALEPVDVDRRETQARVTVELGSLTPVPVPVTLTADAKGTPVDSTSVTIPPNGNRQANLTIPADRTIQELSIDAEPLQAGPFTYRNDTSGADAREDRIADDGAGSDGGGTSDALGAGSGSTRTAVDLGTNVTEEVDGAEDALGGSPLEPVAPAQAGQTAETPGPPVVWVLLAAALAALGRLGGRKA